MDLHSGLAYWIIKNRLYNYHNPLKEDVTIDVAIIDSGITGALVAHELCTAGIPCAVFDKRLEKQFQKIYPEIPFTVDMAWCGAFSSTDDGLPYIGTWPGKKRLFFALGYGGNGITFSMIAAQPIKNKLKGLKDDREQVFGFER